MPKSIFSICREDHARSLTCISAPSSLENIKEDDFSGNFLTLASLSTGLTSSPSSKNIKRPPTHPLLQNLMHSDLELLPFQVRKERVHAA